MGNSAGKLKKVFEDPSVKANLVKAFKAYDKDSSGSVDANELERLAGDLFVCLSGTVAEDVRVGDIVELATEEQNDVLIKDLAKGNSSLREQAGRQLAPVLLQVMDTDKSGSVSLKEWENFDWVNVEDILKAKREADLQGVATRLANTTWHVHTSSEMRFDGDSSGGGAAWDGWEGINVAEDGTVSGFLRHQGSVQYDFVPEESRVMADNLKAVLTAGKARMEWTGKVRLSSSDTELRLKGTVDYTTAKGEKKTGVFNFVAHLKGTTEFERLARKK